MKNKTKIGKWKTTIDKIEGKTTLTENGKLLFLALKKVS